MVRGFLRVAALCMVMAGSVLAQQRYVVVDQDGAGPGDSDQQSILLLLQAPGIKVLGVTMVTGDVDAIEGARHTLRMLELVGRADVPVVMGAAEPLVRTREMTTAAEKMYGKTGYAGAFGAKTGGTLAEGE